MTRLTRRLLSAAAIAAWCGLMWYLAISAVLEVIR